MKVFCDACGTKYSIDDNRVAGKAFKIRCRNCDHVIIRRAPTAPVTEPVPEAGIWYVVIDGTHRPIGLADLHRLRATGKLDDASLVWREGFDDWRELGTIDELCAVAPSVVAVPEARAAAVGARPVLRNERNETSVLFSLGKLANLATRPPAVAPTATAGEGSGLLDIRSIARNLAPAAAHARTERGSLDDLPVYGPVTFGEPAVLVPRPRRGPERRLVWALAASVGLLAVVTTILVVIVLRDGRSAHAGVLPAAAPVQPASPASPSPAGARVSQPPASTAVVPAAPTTATLPAAQVAPAVAAEPVAQAAPAVAARSATQAAPAAAARSATQATATPPARTASASRRAPALASSVRPVAPATSQPLQPRPIADSCSEVSCIVGSYADRCCEIYREHADSHVAPAPGPALPDNLDRSTISAGLSRIDTSSCHDRSPAHGNVTVSIKVSAAGAVTAVTVRSSPDPALSACVTAAARKGTFAQTQRGGSFAYVWRF
jgi:predicted Zn finger-like uncharacterized protein